MTTVEFGVHTFNIIFNVKICLHRTSTSALDNLHSRVTENK